MEVDELRPLEEVIKQVSCFKGSDGIMIITTARLLWKETNQALFSVQVPRTQKITVQRKQRTGADQYWVLKVSVADSKKDFFFKFLGESAERESLRVQQLLNQKVATVSSQLCFLSLEHLEKLVLMHERPQLLEKFRELVIQDERETEQIWQDEDFWNVYKLNKEKPSLLESLIQGVTNRPLILRRKQNTTTQMIDYSLSKDECQRLLLEYPELNTAYEQLVRIDSSQMEDRADWKTNDEFWGEFLSKNLLYQTEPFGGNNPLFIPFRTEEKDYEDRYVHNLHMILEREGKDEALLLNHDTDVNFLNNLDIHVEEGYGAHRNLTEMDALYAKIDAIAQSNITQGDQELSKLDKLAAEQDVMAARIIQKLNNNSHRILKHTREQGSHKDFQYHDACHELPPSIRGSYKPSQPQTSTTTNRHHWDAIRANIQQALTDKPSFDLEAAQTFRRMATLQNTIAYDAQKFLSTCEFDGSSTFIKKHLGINDEELNKFELDSGTYYVKLRNYYQVLQISSLDHLRALPSDQLDERNAQIQRLYKVAWDAALYLSDQMKSLKPKTPYRDTYAFAFKAITIHLQGSYKAYQKNYETVKA